MVDFPRFERLPPRPLKGFGDRGYVKGDGERLSGSEKSLDNPFGEALTGEREKRGGEIDIDDGEREARNFLKFGRNI